jgi:hypothetical protein
MVESKHEEKSQGTGTSFDQKLAEMTSDAAKEMLLSEVNFLDESKQHEKVILTSYPRCGNTLMRSYLEKLTRVLTGSDCELNRKLNKQLQTLGLDGESELDDKVWVVKTHYPERTGRTPFTAKRAIVIVRSPLDCIASLFHMIGSVSHNTSLN